MKFAIQKQWCGTAFADDVILATLTREGPSDYHVTVMGWGQHYFATLDM